jgi:2-methylcitrate dehydratase PrpD
LTAVAPPSAASASSHLAAFTLSLGLDEVPPPVVEAAKLHLLDTFGCGLAASAVGVGAEGRNALAPLAAHGGASVIGLQQLISAPTAAFANGMLCHGLDFDDTHASSITHVGTVVAPAAVAAAQVARCSGADLLVALIAGNEVVTRIGAVAVRAYMTRGFHPTSVCGVFGAAAAASRIRGLQAEATTAALGLAGSMASGIFAYLSDGASTKPMHAGLAAQNGVLAAELAAAGASGPAAVLEDRFGFFAAYFDEDQEELARQLADLGSRWETPEIAFKCYPACHFVHSCLDAAKDLREGVTVDDLDEIVVSIPDPGIPLVLEPRETKIRPRTSYDAKFSLQYSVAAMFVHGSVGVKAYTSEAIRDERVLAVAARVRHEPRIFKTYPAAFPGAVRIRTLGGEVREVEIPYQRGGPQNPLRAEEVVAKFRANASLALDSESVGVLEERMLRLEEIDDAARAFTVLGEATAR